MATKDRVTDQAQEKAQEVAGQAKQQATQAAGQAKTQLRTQVDQRSTQAGEAVSSQASDIRTVAEQLREQGKDKPARVAEQAADRIERVGSYLKESDSDRMLSDVEDFARQRPWLVVAGGMALGFMASRFLKASQTERYSARPQQLPNYATRPAGVTPSPALGGTGNELSSGIGTGTTPRPDTERIDPLGPAGTSDPASRTGTPPTPTTGGI